MWPVRWWSGSESLPLTPGAAAGQVGAWGRPGGPLAKPEARRWAMMLPAWSLVGMALSASGPSVGRASRRIPGWGTVAHGARRRAEKTAFRRGPLALEPPKAAGHLSESCRPPCLRVSDVYTPSDSELGAIPAGPGPGPFGATAVKSTRVHGHLLSELRKFSLSEAGSFCAFLLRVPRAPVVH